jgi:hypothetical protein
MIMLLSIVAHRPVAKQRFCKWRQLLSNVSKIYVGNNRKTGLCNPFLSNRLVNTFQRKGTRAFYK